MHPFDYQDVVHISRCCHWLHLGGTRPLPLSSLRDFIAGRLTGSDPELAAKVRALDDEGLGTLHAELKERQAVVETLLYA